MEDNELQKYVVELRRHFHKYPELGLQELNTSKKIEEELRAYGFHVRRFKGCPTGILAEMRGNSSGEGIVALRADIDALPIHEKSGLPFASVQEGVMHACGHDAHTAMLLGAARLLASSKDEICGTVRLIFEPAEEFAGAGKQILEEKALEGVGSVFAIHVQEGIPAGRIRVQEGVCMAGAGFFSLVVHGKGGHGSAPDKGVDVIPAASAMVMNLQTVVSREISPLEAAVISVGTFRAGSKANIIADEATLTGSLRFYSKEVQRKLPEAVERIIKATADAYRVAVELHCQCTLPPVINDRECSNRAEKVAKRLLGEAAIWCGPPSTGSDDFAYYVERVPGIYAFLGVGNEENKGIPAHNSHFTIEESILYKGARMYYEYAMEYLKESKPNE